MNGKQLSTMLLLATQKHNGQFDMGGQPYILHCLKVMHLLKTDDEELQCIALGHDLIEDTDTTYEELRNAGFSERVVEGIRHMTNVRGETFEDKIARICANKDAMRVKLCDLRHNSDLRRLKGLSEKDFKRMERYQKMWTIINQELNK